MSICSWQCVLWHLERPDLAYSTQKRPIRHCPAVESFRRSKGKLKSTSNLTTYRLSANRLGTADDALLYLVRMAEVEQTKQRWVPGRPDGASVDDAG